jgi:hypothetical protein
VAIDLAGRFDAHVTGLYLVPEIILPIAATGYIGADLYGDIQQQEKERAEAALDRYRPATEAKDVEFDTRIDQGPTADFPALFSVHSRYADLSIIGQTNHEHTVPSPPNLRTSSWSPALPC